MESDDIDDLMAWLIQEIGEGKRDPRIRQIAAKVLSQRNSDGGWAVSEKDYTGEVDALYYYVRENVRYTHDISEVELFQRPSRTLELKIGDCDDLTILLGSLLQSVGYPVILRVVGLNGGAYQHIYILAGIPPEGATEWRPLDASRPEGPGWEVTEGVTLKTDYGVE